jgi:hypothetical protein
MEAKVYILASNYADIVKLLVVPAFGTIYKKAVTLKKGYGFFFLRECKVNAAMSK